MPRLIHLAADTGGLVWRLPVLETAHRPEAVICLNVLKACIYKVLNRIHEGYHAFPGLRRMSIPPCFRPRHRAPTCDIGLSQLQKGPKTRHWDLSRIKPYYIGLYGQGPCGSRVYDTPPSGGA